MKHEDYTTSSEFDEADCLNHEVEILEVAYYKDVFDVIRTGLTFDREEN